MSPRPPTYSQQHPPLFSSVCTLVVLQVCVDEGLVTCLHSSPALPSSILPLSLNLSLTVCFYMFLCFCVDVTVSVCLSVCLSVRLSVCLSVHVFIYVYMVCMCVLACAGGRGCAAYRYTIADMAIYPWMRAIPNFYTGPPRGDAFLQLESYQNLQKWMKRACREPVPFPRGT